MFFRKMSVKESFNSKKGMIFGFYAYLLVSAVNYFYYLFKESGLFSPTFIFWSGLLAFFLFELILNVKDKLVKKSVKN
ncbi:hypothetical protein HMPREF9372_0054 [Sporosarcina newyorkensis 2681]|uniref:Uncharacterized protein n=1 Tax=Sporosarcina newyorkensis 2681 TaxID=1027292 RepID=F9DMM4_9BACL|nr:hypothetical protein [Sporosarcina newyorkensis]EGQ27946.1 hypothetical protein HMPREF9372_0054 [Sporosarcina newyorkensis 2681]